VKLDAAELKSQLLPTLRPGALPKDRVRTLVSECRDLLSVVLPLTRDEREFIEGLNERGEIAADFADGRGGNEGESTGASSASLESNQRAEASGPAARRARSLKRADLSVGLRARTFIEDARRDRP
jgi:hypothetical protein